MSKTIELTGNKVFKDKLKKTFRYYAWRILLEEGDKLENHEICELVKLYYFHSRYLEMMNQQGLISVVVSFPDTEYVKVWKPFIAINNGISMGLVSLKYVINNWIRLKSMFQLRERYPSKKLHDEPITEIFLLSQENPQGLAKMANLYKEFQH